MKQLVRVQRRLWVETSCRIPKTQVAVTVSLRGGHREGHPPALAENRRLGTTRLVVLVEHRVGPRMAKGSGRTWLFEKLLKRLFNHLRGCSRGATV